MFVRFLRLLFGYVRFEATDGFFDRFINLCWSMGIPLWNVKRDDNRLTAVTGRRAYRRMRSAAKKTGVRLHAVEKKGLPFLLQRNKMRAGMLAGLAVGVVFTLYLFSAVWQVDVIGCESVCPDAILAYAREEGLRRGVPRRSIDPAAIRKALVSEFPQINWCAVNQRGARVEIHIREVKQGAEIFDESGAFDIVAAKDGQIELIDAYRGKVQVRNLDTVTKGQLLISGVYERNDGSHYSVHAAGCCRALTAAYIDEEADPSEYSAISSLTCLRSLYLFGAKLPPFPPPRREYSSVSETDLSGRDYVLPIGIVTENAFDTKSLQAADKTDMRLLSMLQAYDAYRDILSDAELIGAEYDISGDRVSIRMRLREDIALEQPIE